MIHFISGKPGEGMTFISCTPPTQQEPARSLAAPAGSESGACASPQNRHQLRRFAWYTRSKRLIRSSLIASAMAITYTTQAAPLISQSSESTSCMVVPPQFWIDFASSFAWGLLGVVLPCFLTAQLVWSVFIVPLIERWLDKKHGGRAA